VTAAAARPDPALAVLRARLAAYRPARPAWPPDMTPHKAAAVLLPIVERGGEPHMLFIQRHADLRAHSGQIAFPGGRVDDTDPDRVFTALREADEELGISPGSVEVLGTLTEIATPTGYLVTPIVGAISPSPPSYRLHPREVEEAFEVPVRVLRDPAVFEDRGEVTRWGLTWPLCAYRPDGREIWGATARMLRELLALWP
jgi:8-oxo-dGTP pyrophosphatase MutT (NUDIX family)